LLGNLYSFVHGLRTYYRAMADFQDLFEYGKIQKEIKDKPRAKNLEVRQREIEFNFKRSWNPKADVISW
jgi:ABC-type transport system involved in Fe-S cluster assembly fused permease/ATPase subunit